jgi:alpha-beta hydrolase superfamily lysophospholipase
MLNVARSTFNGTLSALPGNLQNVPMNHPRNSIHSFSSISGSTGKLETQSWSVSGEAKCVIGIVHGLGEHCGRYHPVAEQLVREGFHVVGYDQRGHGKTGGQLPTFESLLEDLACFTSHLKELHEVVFLYGQSLGGGLVVNFALRNPTYPSPTTLRGFIASSPLLRPTIAPPAWKLLVAKKIGRFWPSITLGSGIDPNSLTHVDAEIEKYRTDPLVHHRVSAALGISMLDAGEWALRHAASLSIPMLLMHGSADQVTSSECSQTFAKEAGRNCQLRLWDGMYHELHFETEREAVLSCAADWISNQCSPSHAS